MGNLFWNVKFEDAFVHYGDFTTIRALDDVPEYNFWRVHLIGMFTVRA